MGSVAFGVLDAPVEDVLASARSCVTDDSVAMNHLIRRYEPLVRKVASSLTADPHLQDDARNGARLGIVRAVRAHDGRTTGFTSFMTYYMRGEARRAVERCRNQDVLPGPDLLPEPFQLPTTPAGEAGLALAVLSEAQQQLVVGRYVEDRTMRDLAREAGTSVAAVSQRLKTIHRVLQPRLSRVGWAA
jgi:RNA polymerase sigma factor (sigma-70 family)